MDLWYQICHLLPFEMLQWDFMCNEQKHPRRIASGMKSYSIIERMASFGA